MKMKIGKLGLQIPIQNPEQRAQISMEPENIKKWRATLPMADIGATAKKLFWLTNELNQIVLEPKKRFEILELLRPSLQLVCQALRKHYINQTTPLTKQKLTIADLARTLQLEVINGYKISLEEMHAIGREQTKKLIPLIIYRIIYYTTMVVLRNYQLYLDEPTGSWQELHLLYKLAKKEKFLEVPINEIGTTNNQQPTILTSYLHVLLLAASDPFQWRQNEQDTINNLLELWVPFVVLRAYSSSDQKKPGCFIFDLEKDAPPQPLGLQQVKSTKSSIVLDVSKICNHLNSILKELEKNELKAKIADEREPEFELSIATLHRLLSIWDTIITRKYKRFVLHGKMQVVFGLSATHHYVGNAKPFEPPAAEMQKNSFTNASPLELTEGIATSNIVAPELQTNLDLTIEPSQNNNNELQGKYVIYNCSLLDISPNGFCLIWENDSYPLVQPGEIIATRTMEDTGHNHSLWNIGVIRWLKHVANGENIRVGVQLLAANAKAAGAQIIKDNIPASYFLRCLILPEMQDLNVAPTIITPTLPFSKRKIINLYTTDNVSLIKAKLTKQIDATNSYRQFEYETKQPIEFVANKIIEKQKASSLKTDINPLNKTETNEAINKFNSIWDKL